MEPTDLKLADHIAYQQACCNREAYKLAILYKIGECHTKEEKKILWAKFNEIYTPRIDAASFKGVSNDQGIN